MYEIAYYAIRSLLIKQHNTFKIKPFLAYIIQKSKELLIINMFML